MPQRIKDIPAHERPRERLAADGARALRDSELVAILLRTGLRGRSAIEVGDDVLHRFSSFTRLAGATVKELQSVPGVGRDKAVTLKAAFELARRMAVELRRESPNMESPENVAQLLREEFRSSRVETFRVVLLNTRRRLISIEHVSQGTLDTILVHPREVFRPAIAANAAAIVLVHNHPSGDPTPSEADIKVTRDLIRSGQLLKIEVLDHVILGHKTLEDGRDFVSLRELGYIYT
jgi:DNA repair protein RadC